MKPCLGNPTSYWLALDCPVSATDFFDLLPTALPPLHGYLLRAGPGLSPFLLFPALKELGVSCGLILHERDCNRIALASDLRSAEEIGMSAIILGDPPIDRAAQPVQQINGPNLLRWGKEVLHEPIPWGVFNSFRHDSDQRLFQKFQAAGLDFVIAPADLPDRRLKPPMQHWLWLSPTCEPETITQGMHVVLDYLDQPTPKSSDLEKRLFTLVERETVP